ncbi:MAG: ATP-dependent Clp protease ATP-binding subunit [Oscillospiraceae bacterium]|nr:ATP-dependent Clp protease ATP-binding subunit [Oscillospiraceae bacterium]
MLCSRCKTRMAVLFLTHMENGEFNNKGLCLKCARDLNIPQVREVMEKMGLNDEAVEDMSNQITELMKPPEESGGEEQGGVQPFPFLQNLFGNQEDPRRGYGQHVPPERKTPGDKKKRPKRKFIDNFCENLTEKAKDGRIDRIVGREREIYRVIQILNRRTKNNPCLIGEPGVGKTAIAEGIAQRLASGNVPMRLAGKELLLLDLTALVAGTQFRGQFESRVKGLVSEIREAGNIILFIDEVHNIVGAGDSEGSMNTANILKPALSRGELQVIGATTFNEYRKYIEKDAALERRFQPVRVEEPSISDTIDVLVGVKSYYEQFHRVAVSDYICRQCAVLSERYITDRFLPDKAIDLLDEACSCTTLKNATLGEYDGITAQLRDIMDEEEDYQQDLPDLTDSDYKRLAEIRVEKMRITSRLKELESAALGAQVTTDDLAYVLELWTGIPASKIRETELRKVANLESVMKEKVIGQDEAVEMVAAAVRRSRIQINGRRRPASFIFVGPTGVGKTELVKVLSKELFDAADPLIRLDMSEFMEKHSVSRIIGSPPGYVGYDEAGQLTEKVRRRPYSVILFDEIEKAHPDVMNILLQILDEGKITDAHGRTVNFENTVIVMTSNAGSNLKSTSVGFNRQEQQIAKDKAIKSLGEFLRPEFIGRVDEVVVFRALDESDYRRIAALMLGELVEPLQEKSTAISWSPESLEIIAKTAFGNKSGARDLRRVIRKEVEDKICNIILESPGQQLAEVFVGAQDGKIVLESKLERES